MEDELLPYSNLDRRGAGEGGRGVGLSPASATSPGLRLDAESEPNTYRVRGGVPGRDQDSEKDNAKSDTGRGKSNGDTKSRNPLPDPARLKEA